MYRAHNITAIVKIIKVQYNELLVLFLGKYLHCHYC